MSDTMPTSEVKSEFDYIGSELELFAHAINWKAYLARHITPYMRGDLAEIGAGLGGTTATLCRGNETSWSCVEPDSEMCDEIRRKVGAGELPKNVRVVHSTLAEIPADTLYDTIIYIDVLEHIEADLDEVQLAFNHLRPGGNLVVLSPAHQFLFSPFDASIGHFRRYTRSSLKALRPKGANETAFFYLDSVGMLASTANKLLLKQSMPHPSQIQFWDRVMVPCSRVLDQLFLRRLGKTVIGVWTKPA